MPASDRDPSRVHWMELFFDLIFVALVGELAHGLHEEPSLPALVIFLALFATVWWSWVNLTFVVNVSAELSRRALALVMISAMFMVGAIAVAAPEATHERAWLFAAGNGTLRILLLALWVHRTWTTGRSSRIRVLVYNGLSALLWWVSVAVEPPYTFVLWGVAIVLEVTMLVITIRGWGPEAMARFNVEHLSERFGLLVIIVLGESVLSTVSVLAENWSTDGAATAVLSMVIVACLAWSFFLYGADALREAGDVRGIRDTVAFLPFPLVAGVTVIAGAIAVAVHHPHEHLPPASAISLGGGIALFYLTNAVITFRFGTPLRQILRWAVPAVVLPAVLIAAALILSAEVTTALATVILLFVVISTELTVRRRSAAHTR